MGWDPDAQFFVSRTASTRSSARPPSAAPRRRPSGSERFDGVARTPTPTRAKEWDLAWEGGSYGGKPLPGLKDALRSVDWGGKEKLATRVGRPEGDGRDGAVRADDGRRRGRPVGVDEDRVPRCDDERFTPATAGSQRLLRRPRARRWAARSTAWRPTAASCARTARRSCSSPTTCAARSACARSTGLHVAWVYTHDSVALGEDGPTHQPVEHLAALRAIPGLVVLRPGRRQRDRRGMARDPRGPRRPGRARALAPGPADARHRLRRRRAAAPT